MRGHFKAQRSFCWLSVTALLLGAALGTFAPSAQPWRTRPAPPDATPPSSFALTLRNAL